MTAPLGTSAAFDARAVLASFASRPRRGGRQVNSEESFWAHVDRSAGPDACWPWKLRTDPSGHGRVSWAGIDEQAHRVAYSLTHGRIDQGIVVRHACDNPPCCNDGHLIAGTIADNNRDARERGRARVDQLVRVGASNFQAKLTDARVAELRAAWAAGEPLKSICRRTGLAMGTIHPAMHGRTWKHVPLVTREALVRSAAAVAQIRAEWDATEAAVAAMGSSESGGDQ